MKTIQIVLLIIFLFCTNTFAQEKMTQSEILSLDKGWKFHLDIPFPVIKGHNETHASTKASCARGVASPFYDDKD